MIATCAAQLLFGVCSALAVTVTVAAAAVTTAASESHLTSRLAQFNLVHL
jgi:Na+-transporting NADH:ubiquinone oxidoreductase subunit NqrD